MLIDQKVSGICEYNGNFPIRLAKMRKLYVICFKKCKDLLIYGFLHMKILFSHFLVIKWK